MFIFASLSTNAQNTNAPKFGKGLFNLIGKDSTWSMKVGLRFQTLATSNWDAQNGLSNPASSMMIRRSRLKFDGFAYSPKLKYKVELGLTLKDTASEMLVNRILLTKFKVAVNPNRQFMLSEVTAPNDKNDH